MSNTDVHPPRMKLCLTCSLLILLFAGQRPVTSPATGRLTVLTNCNLIDGLGSPARPGTAILIADSVIVEIAGQIAVPAGAEVIDCSGMSVLPGLIDMHGHLYANTGGIIESQFEAYAALYLAGGVTTIFTPGEFDPEGATNFRSRVVAGEVPGPRILTAGPYFDHSTSMLRWKSMKLADGPHESFGAWADKVDGVKVYTSATREQLQFLVSEAHKRNLFVTGHLNSISAMDAVGIGIDGLEHGIFAMSEFWPAEATIFEQWCSLANLDISEKRVTALIDAVVERKVYIDPTSVVFEAILPEFAPPDTGWTEHLAPATLKKLTVMDERYVPDSVSLACLRKAILKQKQFIKALHDRGALVVTGTDPVHPKISPGQGLHRELALLVEAGFTPLQAIRAATFNGAAALRIGNYTGSIEEGKRADLVIVQGDPSVQIADVGKTKMIIKNGQLFFPEELREGVKGQIGALPPEDPINR